MDGRFPATIALAAARSLQDSTIQ